MAPEYPTSATDLDSEIARFVRGAHDFETAGQDVAAERQELVAQLVAQTADNPLVWSVVFAMDAHTETDDLELWVLGRDDGIFTVRQERETGKYESRLIPIDDINVRRKEAEFFEGDNAIAVTLNMMLNEDEDQ